MINLIEKYFTGITKEQKDQFTSLLPLYEEWNARINVISRNDMQFFYERHVLFSLAIAKAIQFVPDTSIIDVGCGGGFPGIPLAIMFPDCQFTLVDSIGKKIKVVKAVCETLGLLNVTAMQARAEDLRDQCDFITGRAVTALPVFYRQTRHLLSENAQNALANGILYLGGGEQQEPSLPAGIRLQEWPLSSWFEEDYFQSKRLIHLHV